MLVLSKSDLLAEERVAEAVAAWRERLGGEVPVIATSSATGAGMRELAGELLRRVPDLAAGAERGEEPDRVALPAGAATEAGERPAGGIPRRASGEREGDVQELAEHMVFRPAAGSGFQVERIGPRSFAVRGRGIERLLRRYDVENADAMAYLEGRLRRIGVLRALESEGFRAGDEIEIAGVTFELDN
jgi:GTP-binding protein